MTNLLDLLKPVFHQTNCSRHLKRTQNSATRLVSEKANFFANHSRCLIPVFASSRANKFAYWKTGLTSHVNSSYCHTLLCCCVPLRILTLPWKRICHTRLREAVQNQPSEFFKSHKQLTLPIGILLSYIKNMLLIVISIIN